MATSRHSRDASADSASNSSPASSSTTSILSTVKAGTPRSSRKRKQATSEASSTAKSPTPETKYSDEFSQVLNGPLSAEDLVKFAFTALTTKQQLLDASLAKQQQLAAALQASEERAQQLQPTLDRLQQQVLQAQTSFMQVMLALQEENKQLKQRVAELERPMPANLVQPEELQRRQLQIKQELDRELLAFIQQATTPPLPLPQAFTQPVVSSAKAAALYRNVPKHSAYPAPSASSSSSAMLPPPLRVAKAHTTPTSVSSLQPGPKNAP